MHTTDQHRRTEKEDATLSTLPTHHLFGHAHHRSTCTAARRPADQAGRLAYDGIDLIGGLTGVGVGSEGLLRCAVPEHRLKDPRREAYVENNNTWRQLFRMIIHAKAGEPHAKAVS